MIRRYVPGVGNCRFYVYRRGSVRVRVKTPHWEDVFYRRGPEQSPLWESDTGDYTPSLELSVALEALISNETGMEA